MILPTLYKKTSTGAIQQWTIEATTWSSIGDPMWGVIRTRYGQVGGKIQETEDIIKKGKNPGRANETTAHQQAEREAQAKWEKQVKKGYVLGLAAARAGEIDQEAIKGGVLPMLAHRFDEQGHKIVFPAFAQPKLDGHRCIAVIEEGYASLWSRSRKPITSLPHIVLELEEWSHKYNWPDAVLDGELYHHDYHSRFEELSGYLKTDEPKEGHEIIQYHIYDMAETEEPFAERHRILSGFRFRLPLVAVETIPVADEDELMLAFERFREENYEGLMVRNAAGVYVNRRSPDIQKVKEFQDDEFEVVGVEEGRGKLAGHAIFVCVTENREYPNGKKPILLPGGNRFNAKMKGETAKLKRYFDDPSLAIGRRLTVKYQVITKKSMVPRFPVALRFSDDL